MTVALAIGSPELASTTRPSMDPSPGGTPRADCGAQGGATITTGSRNRINFAFITHPINGNAVYLLSFQVENRFDLLLSPNRCGLQGPLVSQIQWAFRPKGSTTTVAS